MKSLVAGLLLLGLVTTANSAFINNGDKTITDDVTGLDWLSLSETSTSHLPLNAIITQDNIGLITLAYDEAEALYSGWRYATNIEVESMYQTLLATTITDYYTHRAQTITFKELFGVSHGYGDIDYYSVGLYKNDMNVLSIAGSGYAESNGPVVNCFAPLSVTNINGTAYDSYCTEPGYGIYMVRDTPTHVTEPVSLYLLAFGLLGLFGSTRRKV